jgi:hypothetical protein
VKDWRQEISDVIREKCDHEVAAGFYASGGCSRCQETCRDVLLAIDSALDELGNDLCNGAPPHQAIGKFRRSIPEG